MTTVVLQNSIDAKEVRGHTLASLTYLLLACVTSVGCDRKSAEQAAEAGQAIQIDRGVVVSLFREAQESASAQDPGQCKTSIALGHESQVVPSFRQLSPEDIVEFGPLRWPIKPNAIDILLTGPNWPEEGISLAVQVQDGHCVAWGVSRAIRIEERPPESLEGTAP